ncbi:transcriptional regulator [Herbaspirillum robiniae]|uniref:transcriptional regulator n=1 Tax=Herbaspirillum robiniae TaxID=2014887 RepID=UPI0011E4D64D|nr:transcriptional regulator [Herbaspirillum robiniae]
MPAQHTAQKLFSKRLREALANLNPPVTTAAELARQFSLRYKGTAPSPVAVRKWWDGTNMPTDEKLETLAKWLNVPIHWLRFGNTAKVLDISDLSAEEVQLIGHWRAISNDRRKILLALISDLEK